MHKSKGLRRLTALVLVLCALMCSTVAPVNAKSTDLNPSTPAVSDNLASRVRLYPYYSSVSIGCMENGTKLDVLDVSGEFYKISCYEMTGYIAKSQVRLLEDGTYIIRCIPNSSETKKLDVRNAEEAFSLRGQVRSFSSTLIGKPYVPGGLGAYGFDCCGLTNYVFTNLGFEMHFGVANQLDDGVIISKNDLQCGDLVFFSNTTGWGHFASHVGIYIGNGQMIHSGNGGVAIVDFNHAYYQYHFLCARRVILSAVTNENVIPAMGLLNNFNSSYWRENSQTQESGNSLWLNTCIDAEKRV